MDKFKEVTNVTPHSWGPACWKFIYSFVSMYPDKPNQNIIEGAIAFFHSLINLLPCDGCRQSYSIFMKESDTNIDDCTNFISKDAIITFVFILREKVNRKVERKYYLTRNYFCKKLNAMICNKSNKLSGYTNIMSEVPYVPLELEDKVYEYLKNKTQHEPDKTKIIINKTKKFIHNPEFDVNNKDFIFFFYRCVKCRNIYSKLFNCINIDKISIENSFSIYKNLHDRLLFWGCTFLTPSQLKSFIDSQN